jgi:multimeric flavodoxin WrbA
MKIVALLGSRNPEGQTARAANAFLDAAAENGAEVEKVFLPALKIERCLQCNEKGWGICATQGRCVIEDDFAEVTERLRKADGILLATPVYFSDISESLRGYLDRLRRVGRCKDKQTGVEAKPTIGIAVAGGGGGGHVRCVEMMEKILKNIGMEVLDLIPVRRQNLDMKCGVLKFTGAWFVKQVPE